MLKFSELYITLKDYLMIQWQVYEYGGSKLYKSSGSFVLQNL